MIVCFPYFHGRVSLGQRLEREGVKELKSVRQTGSVMGSREVTITLAKVRERVWACGSSVCVQLLHTQTHTPPPPPTHTHRRMKLMI